MSGYISCACRDCFEIAIGSLGALCHACESAGCEPWPGEENEVHGTRYECCVEPDAEDFDEREET